jgi:hypothetical protein
MRGMEFETPPDPEKKIKGHATPPTKKKSSIQIK